MCSSDACSWWTWRGGDKNPTGKHRWYVTDTHTHTLKSLLYNALNDSTTDTPHKEIHTFQDKHDLLDVDQQRCFQYSRCVIALATVATVLLAAMAIYNLLTPRVSSSHPAPSSSLCLPQAESCTDPCK